LEEDPIVSWQHRNYPAIALVVGLLVPTLLGSLWGDALGGFLYGGYVSRILIWHSTWFINSLAHAWGDQEFSHENTSRGNLILALLTFGEGFHNFHHQFPRDYRNGIRNHDWDPTKWLIAGLSYLGLAFDLKKVPEDIILKGIIHLLSCFIPQSSLSLCTMQQIR
jgi:stearoyl-CoA desaturase (delta-9 desaturase)